MDLEGGTSCSLHSVQFAILILFITLDKPPVIPSLKQLHLLIVPITFDLVTTQTALSNIILGRWANLSQEIYPSTLAFQYQGYRILDRISA
ncbi:MAG: hypothetical protein EZS28_010857 [Streblomastix strix]|uniref:Uncharacterized protein n=1 Tax=Streblomastix strix TaxID=222440 RepID=A0A5J4WGF7_9EUKA|nr:MAG: hypothetical protein EZS28_010857 [Streblomastix strix]